MKNKIYFLFFSDPTTAAQYAAAAAANHGYDMYKGIFQLK